MLFQKSSHSKSSKEILGFLDQAPLLAGLDDDSLKFLAENSADIHFSKGSVIFREGDFGKEMFFIMSGAVDVIVRYERPNQLKLAEITANGFFGEMCLLETLPRSATLIANKTCRLVRVSSLTLLKLYENDPKQYSLLMLNIARDLSRRIRQLNARVLEQDIEIRDCGLTG